MSVSQPTITPENIIELTDYINSYRSRHQVPPVSWDPIIATYSQQWSYTMTNTHTFKHSGSALYGENISYFIGYGTDIMKLMKLAIDDWYNEISLYNFNNPGFSAATGHFTCLVWKPSTKFGMGIAIDNNTNQVYVCFNNSPPSNVIGQFQQNVLPLVSPITPPIQPPIQPPIKPPISKKQIIINQLYHILNEINGNYPKYYIINDLNAVINNLILNTPPF